MAQKYASMYKNHQCADWDAREVPSEKVVAAATIAFVAAPAAAAVAVVAAAAAAVAAEVAAAVAVEVAAAA